MALVKPDSARIAKIKVILLVEAATFFLAVKWWEMIDLWASNFFRVSFVVNQDVLFDPK